MFIRMFINQLLYGKITHAQPGLSWLLMHVMSDEEEAK